MVSVVNMKDKVIQLAFSITNVQILIRTKMSTAYGFILTHKDYLLLYNMNAGFIN